MCGLEEKNHERFLREDNSKRALCSKAVAHLDLKRGGKFEGDVQILFSIAEWAQ